MSRNLRRYTNNKYPSKPNTVAQIKTAYNDQDTMQQYGSNVRKTHPFYVNTAETEFGSAFTIFASYEVIHMVKEHIPPEQRRYLIDDTFDVTPPGCFSQLLIIAIEYKNDVCIDFIFYKSNFIRIRMKYCFKYSKYSLKLTVMW